MRRLTTPVGTLARVRWSHRFWLVVAIALAGFLGAFLASPALAVHDLGLFELDRNAAGEPVAGDDWGDLFAGGGSATRFTGILSDIAPPGNQFQGGGSKDNNDISEWLWKADEPLDKDDITNAYAAASTSGQFSRGTLRGEASADN